MWKYIWQHFSYNITAEKQYYYINRRDVRKFYQPFQTPLRLPSYDGYLDCLAELCRSY